MEIYIVFEYIEPTNKIAGIYKNPEDAEKSRKKTQHTGISNHTRSNDSQTP